jgi:hygromycin-B 7''-O-kinase
MTSFLPVLTDVPAFRAWRAEPSRWLPVVTDIAHSHSLPHATIEAFPAGTNLVVALDHRLILKVFPPLFRNQFTAERMTLSQLCGRLTVAIPEIVLEGERGGWSYLVITRLSGILGTEAWPLLPEADKENILGELGEAIAQVQRVPPGELTLLEPKWERFIQKQIEGCRARHVQLGMPNKFLADVDDLIDRAATVVSLNAPAVILTGEYIPENLLLSSQSGAWRLSGLIDFGDVMTGWGEYDLLGPSAFMTGGMPRRVQRLFAGFGYSPADMNQALTRRLLTLMLLHRASDPLRHICIDGWQHKVDTLADLERLLWPIP